MRDLEGMSSREILALSSTASTSSDPTKLEVEQYFSCGMEPFAPDVLSVWKYIEKRFPTLSKMAKDFLSVCASSTASEREFSKAKKVANPWRNRLGEKSMQATLCLKCWYMMPEFAVQEV